jgi:integrase/recombinase XerD
VRIFARFLEGRGVHDPCEATQETIAQFEAHLLHLTYGEGQRYSLSSRQHILACVRKVYRYLVETSRVLIDPTRMMKLPRSPRTLPRTILTPQEMRRLLAAPDVDDLWGLRDRTILELLYGTGLRFSELADLRVGAVDLEEGTLWVRQGKGSKDRLLPLGRWALHWLERYLKATDELRREQGTDRVILTTRGVRIHDGVLNKRIRMYAEQAGIGKHITTHAIRHTVATLLLKGGADIRKIQKLLGHDKLSSTQLYTHLDVGDLREMQRRCHPREKSAAKS